MADDRRMDCSVAALLAMTTRAKAPEIRSFAPEITHQPRRDRMPLSDKKAARAVERAYAIGTRVPPLP
jgi:hypothetical protein